MRRALPTEHVELDDGRRVALRLAEKSDATDVARLGVPPFRAPGRRDPAGSEWTGATVIATFQGVPVGAAWLEFEDQQTAEGRLWLTVESGYRQVGLEAGLVRNISALARAEGCSRLTASIPFISSDVLASFRAADLRIVSCLTLGGTAEVVLERN